jgi:ribosome-associated protein
MAKNNLPTIENLNLREELVFTASRSSGPGGQHVNKVSTKVELRFNIPESKILSEEQKQILLVKLKHKLTSEGDLIILSQETRSQLKNREIALDKFNVLIQKALRPPRQRIKTKPTAGSKEKRVEQKKLRSGKKQNRKPVLGEDE